MRRNGQLGLSPVCASAGLGAAIDRSRGSPAAFKLPSQPEFLFSEEALVRKRSWSENLTYYTGVGYLGGEHPCATNACTFLLVQQTLPFAADWPG